MKNLFNIEQTREIFCKEFSEVIFNYRCPKIGEANLYVFFLSFKDEKDALELWRKVSTAIAIYFQSKIDDSFGKWNTYIFYLIDSSINRDLKYKIENDTFSSRKVVIDNFKKEINDSELMLLLNKHILSSDISLNEETDSSDNLEFQPSELTDRLFSSNLPLGNTNEDKQMRSAWLDSELARIKNHEI